MTQATFLRVLSDNDKGLALQEAVNQVNNAGGDKTFVVNPNSFYQVPGSPFAYWTSYRIRSLFTQMLPFEGHNRSVKVGLQTSDDFRFVRAWWEVPPEKILDAQNGADWREDVKEFQDWCRNRTTQGKKWVPFAKGGEYSPFYADIHLVVNWENNGDELCSFKGSVIRNPNYYFRPGITWPKRTTSRYAPQYLPPGVIFSHVGLAAFLPSEEEIHWTAVFHNTKITQYLVEIMIGMGDDSVSGTAARDYIGGVLGKLPYTFPQGGFSSLEHSSQFWKVNGFLRMNEENSRDFYPSLILEYIASPERQGIIEGRFLEMLLNSYEYWRFDEKEIREILNLGETELAEIESIVGPDPSLDYEESGCDGLRSQVLEEYAAEGMNASSIIGHLKSLGLSGRWITKNIHQFSRCAELIAHQQRCNVKGILTSVPEVIRHEVACYSLAEMSFSLILGFVYGRYIPKANNSSRVPLDLIQSSYLVSEYEDLLGQEDTNVLFKTRRQKAQSRDSNDKYNDGILVEDPGNSRDIVALTRNCFDDLSTDGFSKVESQICADLGVETLRDYVQKPGQNGFWVFHIGQYSKSKRKAPIYWQLSIPSSKYSVWLYYHRFNEDTLYKVLSEYVVPKVQSEERKLEMLQREFGPKPTSSQSNEISEQELFVNELRWMREELEMVAPLWNPNLDDGVELNFALLWRLVPQNKSWQKHVKSRWDELCSGKYDWSYIAMRFWPERAVHACISDRSYAIAHGLEDALWNQEYSGWKPRDVSSDEVERLISERSLKPVQDALEKLLSAPSPLNRGNARKGS